MEDWTEQEYCYFRPLYSTKPQKGMPDKTGGVPPDGLRTPGVCEGLGFRVWSEGLGSGFFKV